MTDLITQTRDYLEAVRAPVTADSVVDHPATPIVDRRPVRRGPLVALATAAAVLLVGLVAVLLQATDPEIPRSRVVDEIIGESHETSHYAVGFDVDGILCAEAGATSEATSGSHASCVAGDRIVAAAYQGNTSVAIAGWVPTSATSLTAIYNGEIRRTLELTPIPGHDLYAFGAIEDAQARFIEIDVRDESGEIIQRYFPSIGPSN